MNDSESKERLGTHTEQLNVTDVVTSTKQAQKILRSINVKRLAEDPIDKIIIERIVCQKASQNAHASARVISSSKAIPRAFDIMDFIEGIDNFKKNDVNDMQGLSENR